MMCPISDLSHVSPNYREHFKIVIFSLFFLSLFARYFEITICFVGHNFNQAWRAKNMPTPTNCRSDSHSTLRSFFLAFFQGFPVVKINVNFTTFCTFFAWLARFSRFFCSRNLLLMFVSFPLLFAWKECTDLNECWFHLCKKHSGYAKTKLLPSFFLRIQCTNLRASVAQTQAHTSSAPSHVLSYFWLFHSFILFFPFCGLQFHRTRFVYENANHSCTIRWVTQLYRDESRTGKKLCLFPWWPFNLRLSRWNSRCMCMYRDNTAITQWASWFAKSSDFFIL